MWSKHHYLLHQFRLQFGHCNVPQGYGLHTHYETLFDWCNEQRVQYHRMCNDIEHREPCTMTQERARILTDMGFVWGHELLDGGNVNSISRQHRNHDNNYKHAPTQSAWNDWMILLSDYKAKHGNVDVPLEYEQDPSLGTFVNLQRAEYRKLKANKPSALTPERVADLEAIGFSWAARDTHALWMERYTELKEFRDKNGHCNVPKVYSSNPSLGYWVNEQRFQYRRLMKKKTSYMNKDKIRMLNELDFKVRLFVMSVFHPCNREASCLTFSVNC